MSLPRLQIDRDKLDAILEYWLGFALVPPERAIREAGWSPDEPEAYCRRCGGSVGRGEATTRGCPACRRHRPVADRVVRLGVYEEQLQQWVLAIKLQRWMEMAHLLGRELGKVVAADGGVDLDEAVVVPIPTPWIRRLRRRIDHTQALAEGLAAELELPIVRLLRHGRARGRSPDGSRTGPHTLTRSKKIGLKPELAGGHFVLVDDVRTTGRTLRTAARQLREFEPEQIVAAVVAVAGEQDRRHTHGRKTSSSSGSVHSAAPSGS